jgi:alanine transaminase
VCQVYQNNVYAAGKAFHSCKKVLRKLQSGALALPKHVRTELAGEEENDCGKVQGMLDAAQLVSFHSTSKGLIGECGQRGENMYVDACTCMWMHGE